MCYEAGGSASTAEVSSDSSDNNNNATGGGSRHVTSQGTPSESNFQNILERREVI